MNDRKLIYLQWLDHHSNSNGWVGINNVLNEAEKPIIAESAGFLVGETDMYYIIAVNLGPNDDLGLVMYILKGAVVYKKLFEDKPKKGK